MDSGPFCCAVIISSRSSLRLGCSASSLARDTGKGEVGPQSIKPYLVMRLQRRFEVSNQQTISPDSLFQECRKNLSGQTPNSASPGWSGWELVFHVPQKRPSWAHVGLSVGTLGSLQLNWQIPTRLGSTLPFAA